MTDEQLLIFLKNPVQGKVKSRLAAETGEKAALQVYLRLLQHTQQITRLLPCRRLLFYSDFIDLHDNWASEEYEKHLQCGTGLGQRMYQAFDMAFSGSSGPVVIIGTDCPGLTTTILQAAFVKLQTHEVVIGPASDGGYYLLGMRQLHPFLFADIAWSTDQVLPATLAALQKAGLSYYLLPLLSDVDVAADLQPYPELLALVQE